MKLSNNQLFAASLIILAVIFRVVNIEMGWWMNFGLMGAVGLFAGSQFKNTKAAILIPILAYFISDVYLSLFTNIQGFYGVSQLFTYASMILVTLLGGTIKSRKPLNILGYSVSGSLIFFIVSNFGVWFNNLFTNFEPGLTLGYTYVRALPFYNQFGLEMFLGSFVGDLIGNVLLFGTMALVAQQSNKKVLA